MGRMGRRSEEWVLQQWHLPHPNPFPSPIWAEISLEPEQNQVYPWEQQRTHPEVREHIFPYPEKASAWQNFPERYSRCHIGRELGKIGLPKYFWGQGIILSFYQVKNCKYRLYLRDMNSKDTIKCNYSSHTRVPFQGISLVWNMTVRFQIGTGTKSRLNLLERYVLAASMIYINTS